MSINLPILNSPRPSDCRGCDLDPIATGFLQPEGNCSNGVLIIGEAGGANEAREGLPFRPNAPAGSVLTRIFRELGLSRHSFGFGNICMCQPPKNELANMWYEESAARHCRVHFNRVVDRLKPKVILALGNVALKSLTKMAGDKQTIEHLRGYVLESPEFPSIHIIASYHPSFIVRGAWNVYMALRRDLQFALHVARNGFVVPKLEYNMHANEFDLRNLYKELESDPTMPLSVDFETDGSENVSEDETLMRAVQELYEENSKKQKKAKKNLGTSQAITQVNFSHRVGTATVSDFIGNRANLCREIIALPNPKIGHNAWCFDIPEAAHNDINWNGETDDTMQMFHALYPDLPGKRGKMDGELDGSFANLQYCASFAGFPFPWKHLVKAQPEWYGCCDADSALRLYHCVKREMQSIVAKNGATVWDGYCKLVYNIQPILTNMQDRGIPANQTKMLEFLRMVVREQKVVGDRIQAYIPDEMRPYSPKTGYKKTPKDTTGMVRREFFLPPSDERCKCMKLRKKDLEYWAEVPFAVVSDDGKLRAPDPACEICQGQGIIRHDEGVVERYVKLEPFNVQSPVQMKMYCKTRRYTIPKNSKNEYSMDKETLNKLAKKYQDEVFKLAISYREYDKMAGTYALGWLDGKGEDGHIHTQFTFFPATGQLSSVRPNVQNVPSPSKFGILAEQFREAVEADDGCVLLELDKKGYHAQTLGFEAGDSSYIRLAKIDIHSYLLIGMEKLDNNYGYALEWSDDELRCWLKWYRKNYTFKDGSSFEKFRNARAKPGVHGYGFGMGSHTLFKNNEEAFGNEREAKKLLDTLDATFPVVQKFRENIPLVAKRQGGKLVSLYGSIRWFWDIGYPKDGKFQHGKDFEKAIAFLPATDAFCDLKLIMTDLEYGGFNEKFGLINQVHDSLLFNCPKKYLEEALHVIPKMMQRPSPTMILPDGSGLVVEVEGKMGSSWNCLEEVSI